MGHGIWTTHLREPVTAGEVIILSSLSDCLRGLITNKQLSVCLEVNSRSSYITKRTTLPENASNLEASTKDKVM